MMITQYYLLQNNITKIIMQKPLDCHGFRFTLVNLT